MRNIVKSIDYMPLLIEVKGKIRCAQQKAMTSVNAQMLLLYFQIGEVIVLKQKELGWGAKVIRKLALDIKNELPEIKGFSYRNISLMVQFYNEYRDLPMLQLTVAQNNEVNMQSLIAQIPWTHNVLLRKDQFFSCPLAIPPLSEQKVIVTKVKNLFATCEQLEAQTSSNQTHAEQLMQSVLKETFQQSSTEPQEKEYAS